MVLRAESRAHGSLIRRSRAIAGGERGQGSSAGALSGHTIELAGALIAAEEEQLVLLERSAERAAELVLLQDLLSASAQRILEETVGIQIFVAEELKHVAVNSFVPLLVTTSTFAPALRP